MLYLQGLLYLRRKQGTNAFKNGDWYDSTRIRGVDDTRKLIR
jgi:hypothetical protein